MTSERSRLALRTALAVLTTAALVLVMYTFLDRPAAWFAHGLQHTLVHTWARGISYLADHTVFFAFTAIGFCVCCANLAGRSPRPWARHLLFLCLTALFAIAMVESVKFVFGRCRPELLFKDHQFGFTWFTQAFVRNSFPSGHTTRIFALATGIALLWRGVAVPAYLLAVLVGVSRVFALMHYPSDVLAGAVLGVLVACWTHLLWRALFDELQQRPIHFPPA